MKPPSYRESTVGGGEKMGLGMDSLGRRLDPHILNEMGVAGSSTGDRAFRGGCRDRHSRRLPRATSMLRGLGGGGGGFSLDRGHDTSGPYLLANLDMLRLFIQATAAS